MPYNLKYLLNIATTACIINHSIKESTKQFYKTIKEISFKVHLSMIVHVITLAITYI